ncbi:MAG: saccharopine dehydrogenase family protein [archaeon]
MGKVLIIGAGGVGNVAVKKCAQIPEVFDEIMVASRSIEKCEKIKKETKTKIPMRTAKVDADNVKETASLISKFEPEVVINLALPYQDLTIMDACLETGTHYIDTANYEPPEEAKFSYSWQWPYDSKFKGTGKMALLGCGFDPGVSNIFCAYAQKHLFDEIKNIDIVDCNAGSHGHPFATNFNPEINIREITQRGKYWEKGQWKEIEPMSISFDFDYPVAGPKKSYLLFHEELESLVKNIKGLERIRFWMTFSQNYITHLNVIQNLGLSRIDEVEFEGKKIVPLKFLKALLPDPSSLGATYTGKTVIGCVFDGTKNGKRIRKFIYNVCDHAEVYKEVQSQAVSYTAGVPPVIGAMMIMKGLWKGKGVFNVEQLNPDPFMEELNRRGLPWQTVDFKGKLLEG